MLYKNSSDVSVKKNEKKAESIYVQFQNKTLKIYLLFLHFMLSKFSIANITMQSITPIITETGDPMSNFFKDIVSFYMKEEVLEETDLQDLNVERETDMKPLKELQVGDDVIDYLTSTENHFTSEKEKAFLETCRDFLIKAAKELQTRLQLAEEMISRRHIFHPKNAISQNFRIQVANLDENFEIDPSEMSTNLRETINKEWQLLPSADIKVDSHENTENFWIRVSKLVDDNGDPMYGNLSHYVLLTMVMVPNSNASAERIFRKMNLVKSDLRCKLSLANMEAIMLTSELVRDSGGINEFEPTNEMI